MFCSIQAWGMSKRCIHGDAGGRLLEGGYCTGCCCGGRRTGLLLQGGPLQRVAAERAAARVLLLGMLLLGIAAGEVLQGGCYSKGCCRRGCCLLAALAMLLLGVDARRDAAGELLARVAAAAGCCCGKAQCCRGLSSMGLLGIVRHRGSAALMGCCMADAAADAAPSSDSGTVLLLSCNHVILNDDTGPTLGYRLAAAAHK